MKDVKPPFDRAQITEQMKEIIILSHIKFIFRALSAKTNVKKFLKGINAGQLPSYKRGTKFSEQQHF